MWLVVMRAACFYHPFYVLLPPAKPPLDIVGTQIFIPKGSKCSIVLSLLAFGHFLLNRATGK